MKIKYISCIILFAIVSCETFVKQSDEKEIENIVTEAYINGLINAKDFEKARWGIHEDFVILGHRDTMLTRKTRDAWIEQRGKRINLEDVSYSFDFIDISGNAASVKISMTRGNLVAVDYVFLYNINDTWRIVSAIDHVEIEENNK